MSPTRSRLERFLTSDYDQQRLLLQDPETVADLKQFLGQGPSDDLLRQFAGGGDLGAGPKNLIFVPGVMGSTLQSAGLGGVWWIDMIRARDKLNGLALTPDGITDQDPAAEITPAAIDVSYVPFRRVIAESNQFGGSEQFPYDWRRQLKLSAALLRDRIIACHHDYSQPVHLVGHSMGGLMIRTALMLHGDEIWPKVGKIVFIGTPHYGAAVIAGYLKNHLWGWEALAIVGMFFSRETFRSMRGVLSLLPAPVGIYPGTRANEAHPCANFDLYDATAWKLDLDAWATRHLQDVLDEVGATHTALAHWHSSLLQEQRDRMLMIAGVGQETLFRLEFDQRFWGLWKHTKKIVDRTPGNAHREGDERVPLASAQLENVSIRYIKGRHGSLPNIPAVSSDILAWLADRSLTLPETPNAALGGHLFAHASESAAPSLDGSAEPNRYRDLPEYEDPTDEFRERIDAELGEGKLPKVNLARIL